MYVFRDLTDFSYPAIAREFGGRDHTTVMHAVEKISSLMKERHQIYDQVTELILRIKSDRDRRGRPAPAAPVVRYPEGVHDLWRSPLSLWPHCELR